MNFISQTWANSVVAAGDMSARLIGGSLWHNAGGGPAQTWMPHLVMEMPVSPAGLGQWKWVKYPAFTELKRTLGLMRDKTKRVEHRGRPVPGKYP